MAASEPQESQPAAAAAAAVCSISSVLSALPYASLSVSRFLSQEHFYEHCVLALQACRATRHLRIKHRGVSTFGTTGITVGEMRGGSLFRMWRSAELMSDCPVIPLPQRLIVDFCWRSRVSLGFAIYTWLCSGFGRSAPTKPEQQHSLSHYLCV